MYNLKIIIPLLLLLCSTSYSQGWVQEQMDTTSGKLDNNLYGNSVDIQDSLAIAGSERYIDFTDTDTIVWSGAAYIFKLNTDGDWQEIIQLKAFDASFADFFGRDVAIEDTVAIVTAPEDDSDSLNSGSCYIYELIDDEWVFVQKIIPESEITGGGFGTSCVINNGRIAIGAPGMKKVFIYEKIGEVWTETFVISKPFGIASQIDLYHDRLVFNGAGAFVYERIEAEWIETTNLKDLITESDPNFGRSLAVWDDFVLVGSPRNAGPSYFETGMVWVFKNIGGVWNLTDTLYSGEDPSNITFGDDIDIDSNKAVIGFPGWNSRGAFEVFELEAETWNFQDFAIASNGLFGDGFGDRVSISNNWILSGAPQKASGRTYFFSRCERLDVTISDLEICFGDTIILEGFSNTLGEITWSGEFENGEAFVPNFIGVNSYEAFSSSDSDCAFSTSIIMQDSMSATYEFSDGFGDGDWLIDLEVSGGLPPYYFDWDTDELGDFDDLEDIEVYPGVYEVIIMDDLGCVRGYSIDNTYLSVENTDSNGLSFTFSNDQATVTINGEESGSVFIYDINGRLVLSSNVNGTKSINFSNQPNGAYLAIVASKDHSIFIKHPFLKF